MKQLVEILDKNKYKKIKFKITKTQHLIKAKINGVAGNFILILSSNSCIGFESIELFIVKSLKQWLLERCYRNADSNSYQQSFAISYGH
jgi:hypothetical protein